MSTKPASIAMLLDNSGSMGSKSTDSVNTNLQLLQTDSNTFIYIMQNAGKADNQLGQLGLVNFNTSVSQLYPLTSLDAAGTQAGTAVGFVNGLSPVGYTNIKGAITQGHSMLNGVNTGTYNRGMVLFSDGMWNAGGDPSNPPTDIPIFSIGYGTSANLNFLQTISTKTGGQYHITGDPGILATFYNDIINETAVAHTVANTHMDLTPYCLFTTNVNVPSGQAWNLFAATWADNDLNYTAGTPGPGQIQVVLNDPSGAVIIPDVVEAPNGGGFAILTVNTPVEGIWKITTHPSNFTGSSTLGAAHGVFVSQSAVNADLVSLGANGPLRVAAHFSDDGIPFTNMSIQAYSVHPRFSNEELITLHANELNDILIENNFPDDVNPMEAAVRVLHESQPELGLFDQVYHPGALISQPGMDSIIEVQDHKTGVPNTVYVVFKGENQNGDIIQRTRLVTDIL